VAAGRHGPADCLDQLSFQLCSHPVASDKIITQHSKSIVCTFSARDQVDKSISSPPFIYWSHLIQHRGVALVLPSLCSLSEVILTSRHPLLPKHSAGTSGRGSLMATADEARKPPGILRQESSENAQQCASPGSYLGISATQSQRQTPKCMFRRSVRIPTHLQASTASRRRLLHLLFPLVINSMLTQGFSGLYRARD
jgi:hypothetical protein